MLSTVSEGGYVGVRAPSQEALAMNVTNALALIDSIPYSVLEAGQGATSDWVSSRAGVGSRDVLMPSASFFGCTFAIGGLIAGNVIAVGKLLKIKRLIGSLGGVSAAVRLMWGASFSYEKMLAAGGALAALAGEFFGIKQVRDECFS